MQVTFADVYFPKIKTLFDESGNPTDPNQKEKIVASYKELIWMAKSLKWGRNNLEKIK